jgi:hypothetical protein
VEPRGGERVGDKVTQLANPKIIRLYQLIGPAGSWTGLGEDVAAAVALKPGGTATPEELREHVKSQVVAQQLAHQTPHLVGRLVLAATGPGLGGVPGSPAVLWSLATPRRPAVAAPAAAADVGPRR